MVAAARPPVRFFSPDAPVVDLYLGQLDQVKFKDSDLMAFTVFSFVWYFICSNCKREQMERAKRVSKAPVKCFGIVVIKLVVLCEIERVFLSSQVERLRSVAEVSFIFFYAPWCAHSMAARQEVQQVAKKLAKQVQVNGTLRIV